MEREFFLKVQNLIHSGAPQVTLAQVADLRVLRIGSLEVHTIAPVALTPTPLPQRGEGSLRRR